MSNPKDLLAEVITATDNVLVSDLNAQQVTFVTHIRNTARTLREMLHGIPMTDYALHRIIPILGDTFETPQRVIIGYAKMLRDHPEHFNNATLSAQQRDQMQIIYDSGIILAQQTEQIKQAAFQERKQHRNAPPTIFDLNMLVWQNIPIYRYLLKDAAIKLTANMPQGLPPIIVNPYHLAEIVQHIIMTTAQELMAFGDVQLRANYNSHIPCVTLSIHFAGLTLDDDAMASLFEKQGRHLVRQRITQQAITLHRERERDGSFIHLDLPLPKSV